MPSKQKKKKKKKKLDQVPRGSGIPNGQRHFLIIKNIFKSMTMIYDIR